MPAVNYSLARDLVDRLGAEPGTGIVFIDRYGHRRDYNFAEIAHHSMRYAGALIEAGVTYGERVLVALACAAKCAFTMLALERIGAVIVPAPQDASAERFAAIVRETLATTVVGNPVSRPALEPLRHANSGVERFLLVREHVPGWTRLDTLAEETWPFAGFTTQVGDELAISGGAIYDRAWIANESERAAQRLEAATGDVVWLAHQPSRAQWIADVLAAPWTCSAATLLYEGAFDARERLSILRDADVTVLEQSPLEYHAMLAVDELRKTRLPRFRRWLCSGDLDAQTRSGWQTATGSAIA